MLGWFKSKRHIDSDDYLFRQLEKQKRTQEAAEKEAAHAFGAGVVSSVVTAAEHDFTVAQHRVNTIQIILLAQILDELKQIKQQRQ